VDQTDGEGLLEVRLPNISANEAFEGSVETLKEIALSIDGNPVTGIELRPRQEGDPISALGCYSRKTKHIVVVTDGQSRAQQFSTLCHEVAHALLHPIGDPHGAPEREVEAESTAFIICHALALDTSKASFPYVALWASRDQYEDPLKMLVAGVNESPERPRGFSTSYALSRCRDRGSPSPAHRVVERHLTAEQIRYVLAYARI
jgi:hypothetical protein